MLFQTRKKKNRAIMFFVFIVLSSIVGLILFYNNDIKMEDPIDRESISQFFLFSISWALLVVGLFYLILTSIAKVNEEEDKENVVKKIYSSFDELCNTIFKVINEYGLVRDGKIFYSKWDLNSLVNIKFIMKNVRLSIVKNSDTNKYETPEMFEFGRIIDICMKYIAIVLEEKDGLFEKLKHENTNLEKMIREGREGSISRREFSYSNKKIRDLESEINKAKNLFEALIKLSREIDIDVFNPESYKYRHYYVLIIQRISYLHMNIDQIRAKEEQEHKF